MNLYSTEGGGRHPIHLHTNRSSALEAGLLHRFRPDLDHLQAVLEAQRPHCNKRSDLPQAEARDVPDTCHHVGLLCLQLLEGSKGAHHHGRLAAGGGRAAQEG